MQIAICGISTNVGKSFASASLCHIFGYDYFKLIQAGKQRDLKFVKKFLDHSKVYPDGIFLKTPKSPHIGRGIEKLNYDGLEIKLPKSQNLIIELAGGICSPIDDKSTNLDFIKLHKLSNLLVYREYLGSINHAILSLNVLLELDFLGLIISGAYEAKNAEFLKSYAKKTFDKELKIAHLPYFNLKNFKEACAIFENNLKEAGIFF
ncbi:MAG: ATP-dependent dethiobiotin synthetase BioD [Helicobacter sp.]|nr:ATP-dependent dethiobiotin synthetase BioD [Helicobacter sp.]